MPTQAAEQAMSILRDASNFQWYVVTLLLVVIYVYSVEAQKKNWSAILAGLAFWGCDWFNEIWNALIFHFTNYAALWMTPGKTAYLILIGLNVEIIDDVRDNGCCRNKDSARGQEFEDVRDTE